MGGVQFPHLNNLARSIWQWCEERGIWLFASYINTKDNVEADEESRKVNPDVEWSLTTTIKDYIEVTKDLRQTSNNNLLLTFKRPHKAATAQSISRWIKQVLSESGVDVSVYSGHSTRHASTSAASSSGLSVEAIRKAAGWTKNSETFAKFYHRQVLDEGSFAKSVCLPRGN
ncbi:unnamed protein product [Plutella xylostella]|uniref:(diamondback moth) hypothetical protein n=1 Tax=Plutella xylostella TaxID=51655 RepID=A0A8S4G6E1_PLUXY|nr:unnamed protein product [Plutella xylostella]